MSEEYIDIPDKEKVNALEVEVDRNHRDLAQRKLLKFYCRSTKESREYPNGIRLRFVKPFSEAVSTNEKSKINLLRQRQAEFLNGIVSRSTWDVVHLDYARDNEPTLRQMIMSLKTKDDDNIPLFHCVDLDWKRDGFTFQYAPNLAGRMSDLHSSPSPKTFLSRRYFPRILLY